MSGLLSVVGNAYDLIVKIFKKIQYSITGWPAGNPNVEDSNRPQLTNIPKSSFNFFYLKWIYILQLIFLNYGKTYQQTTFSSCLERSNNHFNDHCK